MLSPLSDAWDSHIHVIDPDRFPLAEDRDYTPRSATKHAALEKQRALGLQNTVIVQPSVYGVDNSCLVDALSFMGDRAVGICVIDPETIDIPTIDMYHAAGIRGIRVNYGNGGDSAEILEVIQRNASIARRHDWILDLWVPQKLWHSLHGIIPSLRVTVVADHYGHAQVGSKTGIVAHTLSPAEQDGFEPFLDLVRQRQIYVKLSAPYQNSKASPTYQDMSVVAKKILAAGPDMCIFGSDWPHTSSKEGNITSGGRLEPQPFRDVNDELIMNTLREWCGNEEQVRKVFADNPQRLWRNPKQLDSDCLSSDTNFV